MSASGCPELTGTAGMVCPYCGGQASLVDSAIIYPHSYGPIYLCKPCDAHVGVHPGTTKPLGTLANRPLRAARMKTHAVLDPLWKDAWKLYPKLDLKGMATVRRTARTRTYAWLAEALGISVHDCHVGMFDQATCVYAQLACADMTAAAIREWAKQKVEGVE